MSIVASSGYQRRHDLDWLRVIALGFLILYHVSDIFNSGGWEIKSVFAGTWADGAVELVTPWRMVLVFVIGGAASRFLFEKFDAKEFALNRTMRLLVPFAFGVLVLAPPQLYVHLREAGLERGSFLDFWAFRFWTTNQLHGVHFPDFAHVWFLPYLFMYAVGAAFAWSWLPRLFEGLTRWVDRAPVLLLLGLTMAWLVLIDTYVDPWKHRTMLFFWDLTGHLRFASAFLFGLLIAQSASFWRKLAELRWSVWVMALVLGVLSYGAWFVVHGKIDLPWLKAIYGAATLFAALALGARFLNRPSKALTYCNDAVLPVYLLHQTVLVLIAVASGALTWPVTAAFPFLVAATLGLSVAIYHLVIRRNRWLRLLFGQSPRAHAPPSLIEPRPAT